RACHRVGMGIGNLGHLVQVPLAEVAAGASLKPDYWTVFNMEKAAEAGLAAEKLGRLQPYLARIQSPGDSFYRGHEGGFDAERILEIADRLDRLEGGKFAGITTFPALLFDEKKHRVLPTHNARTLETAASVLHQAGRDKVEINAPGTVSASVLDLVAAAGATQVEPGHGLTGTTPLHAVEELPEAPAVVYLSEVAHLHQGRAYCFGGGLYIDPVFPDYDVKAVVSAEPTVAGDALRSVEIPPPAAIDYYGMIDAGGAKPPRIGDSVVFGFRPQAFVTRAYVAGISGCSTGQPKVEIISDAWGRPAEWPI
ncbi:MAG TPA: alanine racemase, partial [Dongiaceae bacterium]